MTGKSRFDARTRIFLFRPSVFGPPCLQNEHMTKSTENETVRPDDNFDHVEDTIDRFGRLVFSIRWGLVPMYLGLWLAIMAYNVQFAIEMGHFLVEFHPYPMFKTHTETEYLLWILGLIDMTMIGNLVVMTTIGGFSTFVREFDLSGRYRMPNWLIGLDSNTLKIKMGMSLVGVSAIHLLRTFMSAENASWDLIWKVTLIHVVFMFTTMAFTFNAKFMPKNH